MSACGGGGDNQTAAVKPSMLAAVKSSRLAAVSNTTINCGITATTAAADQSIVGTANNDVLNSTQGNDTIDGLGGLNTVVYQCSRSNYTITKTTNGWTVTSAAEGTDTLANIQRLQFTDQIVALDVDGNAGMAYRIYQAAFNRTPDNEGLKFWIAQLDNGAALQGIANGFIQSAEFTALYGPNPSNGDFVTRLYSNVLHRAAEQSGYNWWLNKLDSGTTKTEVLIGFSESAENKNGVLSAIQNGILLLLTAPVFKTSYENKNSINFDESQVFTVRQLGIPKVYANEQDSNERSVAFADFFQDGKYSAFVSSLKSANLYNNPDINDIPGVAYFLSQDLNGVWRDRTSELIKKVDDRTTCVNTSYSIIADFNNDDKPDIYIACSGVDYDISSLGYSAAELQERYTSNQLLYLSQKDGTYKRVEVPFRIYAHQAAAADIDGDGFIDIVSISAADPNLLKVAVFLGHGDGTFTQTFDKNIVPSSSNIETLHNIWGVALIPIDGRLDLILNGGPPFASYWVKGNGKGGFDFGSVRKILMPNSEKKKSQYSFPLDTVYDGGNFYYYTTSQWDPLGIEWAIVKFNISSSTYETIYSWENQIKTFQSYSGQFKPTASGTFVAYTGGCGHWGDPAYPISGVLSKIGGCAMKVKFK